MQVDADASFSCAVATTGEIACWGSNDHGQTEAPPGTFVQVAVGFLFGCALDAAGSVTCWGDLNGAGPP